MICLLWQVPEQVDIHACLDRVADHHKHGARYARMLESVGDLRREVLQPMYTERLDERIRAGETARIVQTASNTTNPAGAVLPSGLTLS